MDSSTLPYVPLYFEYKGCQIRLQEEKQFAEMPILHANRVEPDQTPRTAASDGSPLFADARCYGLGHRI